MVASPEEDYIIINNRPGEKNAIHPVEETAVAGQPFAVVVSDYQLPDGTGLEFLAWLRETQKSQVPFLLVSGSYTPPEVDGFVYLAKPYRPDELRARINQLAGLT